MMWPYNATRRGRCPGRVHPDPVPRRHPQRQKPSTMNHRKQHTMKKLATAIAVTAAVMIALPSTTNTVAATTTIPGECWITDDPGNVIPAGSFVLYDTTADAGAVGTHSISGIACGPPVVDTPPDTPATNAPPHRQLPATGSEPWFLVAAIVATVTGYTLRRIAR